MSRTDKELDGVTLLGNQNTQYKTTYAPEVLETFENKHKDNDYVVTFDAYEFTSLCVAGETLIDVARDESKYPHGIPIKDLVGTEGYVFGVDDKTLQPVARRYSDVRCTRKNAKVVKIVVEAVKRVGDENKHELVTIRCTPDHLVLVKKGFTNSEWIEAKDLKKGMRLIADQRNINSDQIRGQLRHRLIAENLFEDIDTIHHKDGNHFNNSPDNLENLSPSEHMSHHRKEEYGYDEILDIDLLVQLYNSGENFHSLAKMYNCDVSTIDSRIGHLVERRTQSESLKIVNEKLTGDRNKELYELYEQGYLLSELSAYSGLHPTRISEIIVEHGGKIRESNYSRYNRRKLDLPPLNHRVVAVVDDGYADVYNMEVEDVHNFFANGVTLHNCPKTGQPDFAKIVISYIPNERMVESKSLKLYLFSFRNQGDFHEDCINMIGKDLVKLMDPKYLEVRGIFASRGGIAIVPFYTYSTKGYEDIEKQRKIDILRDGSNRTAKYDK